MSSNGVRSSRVALAVMPAAIVALGCGASLVPRDLVMHVGSVLAVWLTLSLPVGVAVGRCALGEADAR
jgi:hypothetical protein